MLRPGTTVEDVDAVAKALRWPMTNVTERDRAAGTEGRVTWEAHGAALHYAEDAMFGIGHYALSGPRGTVRTAAARAAEALAAWTVPDLCRAVDGASDPRARGQAVLRLGLAADGYDEQVFRRVAAALRDADARVRYAALFAASYSGFPQFGDAFRALAERDPEPFVRERAALLARAAR